MKTKLVSLLFLAGFVVPAHAAPVINNGSSEITANIPRTCVISAATGVAFGTYNAITTHASQHLDAQSTMTVRCAAGSTGVSVMLQKGNGLDATCDAATPVRSMRLGTTASYMSYGIYQDVQRTVQWGCSPTNLMTLPAFVSSTTDYTVRFYGRVPSGQYGVVGSYVDVVQVSVTF